MIAYGCVLPHAPLLTHLLSHPTDPASAALRTSLELVAQDLKRLSVEGLISISGHPCYQRDGFSAYVSDRCCSHFRDLGDLTHESDFPTDWRMYTALREARLSGAPLIHPLDERMLDFGHSVPLWCLTREMPEMEGLPLLALNDFPAASLAERLSLGQALCTAAESDARRYAVLISAECAFALPQGAPSFDSVKMQNTEARHQISSLWASPEPSQPMGMPACSSGAAVIAYPSFHSGWRYEELAFEHVQPTSVLVARLQKAS